MANQYKSSAVLKNSRARPDSQYEAEEATFTVSLPAGYNAASASGDTYAFCILGENVTINRYNIRFPVLDTNATAAFAGKLGIVAYAGAGASQTWTGTNDAALLASGTVVQTNTTGAKDLSSLDGDVATGGGFNTKPFPVQTSQQIVVFNVTANASTNGASATATNDITLTIAYQYAYPDTFVSGVTGVSSSNLLGTKSTSQAVVYLYGPGASPNAP